MKKFTFIIMLMFMIALIIPVDALSYTKVYPKKYDVVKGKTVYRSIIGANGHAICLKNYPDAKKPTLAALIMAMKKDNTDQRIYTAKKFTCTDYAETFHNNMELKKIKTGFVSIEFDGTEQGHAFNCVQTSDAGLVYIDLCGSSGKAGKDRFSYPAVGKSYTYTTLDGKTSDMGKTVRSIQVFW